jgi:hypothetical protein
LKIKMPTEVAMIGENIGHALQDAMPNNYGFALLIFTFDDFNKLGEMHYFSNAVRDDMIKAMKELITNMEKEKYNG